MPPEKVLGWDIGGANVKVAVASSPESIVQTLQKPCPLWLGIDPLRKSISSILSNLEITPVAHAITMTGELVDYFDNRKIGVSELVTEMTSILKNASIGFYAGSKGFVSSHDAIDVYQEIASANWLASANFIATKISDALFVDVGSTTTDVIRISSHKVEYEGYTDAERLYAQELVYCGVVRTPVFALCKSAPINEKFIPVINEFFANAADIYRLTKELPEYADMSDTLDGRNKDVANSAARLARMFGHDVVADKLLVWQQVAQYIREQQLQIIIQACRKQLTKSLQIQTMPIVGAGVGRFLVREIARRFNRQYIDFEDLCIHEYTNNAIGVGDCAPAAAIACLGYQRYCS